MIRNLFIVALATVSFITAEACTSAIVSASRSAENAAILWKHRDSSTHDTAMFYFDDGPYARVILSPSYNNRGKTVYGGLNSAGLGLMNTATTNLNANPEDLSATEECLEPDNGESLFAMILRTCATIDDVEQLLKSYRRSYSYHTNLGVGDATGNAAYFEIWNDGYKRYDAVGRKDGFDVRANFSFAGTAKRGASERRYDTVMDVMSRHSGTFSVSDFISYSRSYYSAPLSKDILWDGNPYKDDNYCIPRRQSVANIIIVCGSNARIIVANGHPEVAVPVPVWVASKGEFPACLRPGGDVHRLSREYVRAAYDRKKSGAYLNKELVRSIDHVRLPSVDRTTMPVDIGKFYADVDAACQAYACKVRRILK